MAANPMKRYRTIVADPPWQLDASPSAWQTNGRTLPYEALDVPAISALPIGDLALAGAELYCWTINQRLVDTYEVVRRWGFDPIAVLVWCKPPRGLSMGGKFASNVEFILFCRDLAGIRRVTSYLADCAKSAGVTGDQINAEFGFRGNMAGHWLARSSQPALPRPEYWHRLKRLVSADDRYDDEIAAYHEHGCAGGPKSDTRWFQWPRGEHSAKPEAFLDLVEQVSPGPYLELFARRQRFGWDTWGDEALDHTNGALGLEADAQHRAAVPEAESPEDERVVRGGGSA